MIKGKAGGTDIDVVTESGDFAMVGGEAKANDHGKLGSRISIYLENAAKVATGVQAWFAEGTPAATTTFAAERLGKANVHKIPNFTAEVSAGAPTPALPLAADGVKKALDK